MGAEIGMLVVETIAKIRRAYFVHGQPIKAICRDLGVSRKVVRKVIRSEATEFRYEREAQPRCDQRYRSAGGRRHHLAQRCHPVAKRLGEAYARGPQSDRSESVRRLQAGLHSFLSMRRIEARRKNASAFRLRHSQSLAKRRQRLSQAMVRSTIQRFGKTTNPLT